jgi:hypothetical protein
MPLILTTDLKSDIICGLFGCDLDQANVIPNDNGTFLDLELTDASLLKLDRHHKANEIEMRVPCCEF